MNNESGAEFHSPETAPATRLPWGIVGLLMAFSFMSYFNRTSMAEAGAGKIIPGGVLSETEMGATYSALLIAYTVFMLPGGWLTDRAGPRKALIIMGVGTAFFTAMTGAIGHFLLPASGLFAGLIVTRALMGICTAPIYPASGRMVAVTVPPTRQAEVNGLVIGMALIGSAVTPFACGYLMDRFNWPGTFVFMGGVTAALAVVWIVATRRLQSSGMASAVTGEPDVPWLHLLLNRRVLFLTAAYAFIGYYQNLFVYWGHRYFDNVMHLDTHTSRLYATLLYVATAVGMFSGGFLADWLERSTGSGLARSRLLVAISGLVSAAIILSVGLSVSQQSLVVACLALAWLAMGLVEGPMWAMAVESGGRRGGSAGAIFNTGGNIGGIFSPMITPILAATWGWTAAVSVAIGACLAAIAFLIFAISSKQSSEK